MQNYCSYQLDDGERARTLQKIPSLIIEASFERSMS